MGLCYFVTVWGHAGLLGVDDLLRLFDTATGIKMTGSELMRVGQRVHNIEKAFNTLHADFKREDDYPPKRFMHEPIGSGPHKGEKLDEKGWNYMLDEYYRLHGWDVKTGWQTRKCVDELELEEVKEKLHQSGKLIE